MADTPDEPTLILSAQRGDLEAFNLLVERHQDALYRVAYRILGDQDSAADATQLAWIAAFRCLKQYRGGRLASWLMRILVNTCYDQIRARNRRREVGLYPENNGRDELETPFWLQDTAPTVEESVEARQRDEAVQRAMQAILPVYRAMITLVDIEGYRYEEAAAILHVPLGTVRSRVARGRMALRRQLEQDSGFPRSVQPGTPASSGSEVMRYR